jgi:hypothetical protein
MGWLRSLFTSEPAPSPDDPASPSDEAPTHHQLLDQRLNPPDHEFVCALAEALELTPEPCLELLTRPMEDSPMDHERTEIRDGSFVSLNLFRKLGQLQQIPGLDRLGQLVSLNCAIHSLRELDLRGNPLLENLDCGSHFEREFRIDVSGCPRISDVRYNAHVEYDKKYWSTLVCTELQKRVLFPRARKGFEVVPSTPDEMHRVVQRYNWDSGTAPLKWVAKHAQCDRGTALMIYWMGNPHWYTQHAKASDVPAYEKEAYGLLSAIEKRYVKGGYERSEIRFDPRADDSRGEPTDWTVNHYDDIEVKRPIPEGMFEASC